MSSAVVEKWNCFGGEFVGIKSANHHVKLAIIVEITRHQREHRQRGSAGDACGKSAVSQAAIETQAAGLVIEVLSNHEVEDAVAVEIAHNHGTGDRADAGFRSESHRSSGLANRKINHIRSASAGGGIDHGDVGGAEVRNVSGIDGGLQTAAGEHGGGSGRAVPVKHCADGKPGAVY